MADENVFEVIDAKGNYIAPPGLIDVHIHGSDGADVMDATPPEAIGTMARFLVKYGIVGFLPSTVSAEREETRLAVQNVADYKSGGNEAEVLGIHLEGPYLNFEFKGAQYGPAIRQADLQELEQLYEILGSKLKLITMAPEVPGSKEAIAWLTERGVLPFLSGTAAPVTKKRSRPLPGGASAMLRTPITACAAYTTENRGGGRRRIKFAERDCGADRGFNPCPSGCHQSNAAGDRHGADCTCFRRHAGHGPLRWGIYFGQFDRNR